MACMFYEVDEVFNEAVMTGVPAIIVEGIDDICVYEGLVERVPFDVEVYAVEFIQGYGQGCEQVIRAITDLENLPGGKHKLSKNVLGVIDKDVREYRNEIPVSDSIFVLKYYSIESHFVSRYIVESTLNLCTKSSRDMVSVQLCELIMKEIEVKILDLYYFSLESLRSSVDRNYTGVFSYSFAPGRIKDARAKELVSAKKDELDAFARSLNISLSMNTIKEIAKGKWLIDVFSEELINCIEGLQGKCKDKEIISCRSCLNSAYEKCLYRIRDGINKNTIKSLAVSNIHGNEFDYIVDRIASFRPVSAQAA